MIKQKRRRARTSGRLSKVAACGINSNTLNFSICFFAFLCLSSFLVLFLFCFLFIFSSLSEVVSISDPKSASLSENSI